MAALIHSGDVSACELTGAALARMERREPAIQAFCTPTPELALAQARAVDARRTRGETLGALAGVPLAVKDLICTANVRTTSGSAAYKDFIPEDDDITVERLLAADAILVGKTTAPEFGYSGVGHNPLFPSPRNPWDLSMTPGGSSAGSGAAVAARLCPIALGSDGGGSVRIPAAHCGIFGFKASMGRVPLWPGCRDERYPGVSSWESLEHIGPMTRSVRDAALMAGPDMRDRHSIPCSDVDWLGAPEQLPGKLHIAFSADFGYVAVDPEVRAVGAAVDSLTNGGNFLPMLMGHSAFLSVVACLFVFINLGSVCTHCLYNGAVGFSHLFSSKMRLWTLILGAIGGVLALAGVWSYFLEWLSLLGIVVPPFGAVMIVDLIFMARISEQRPAQRFRGTAFAAWAIGSLCAVIAHVAFPEFGEAVIGLVTAAISYSVISKMRLPRPVMENSNARLQR